MIDPPAIKLLQAQEDADPASVVIAKPETSDEFWEALVLTIAETNACREDIETLSSEVTRAARRAQGNGKGNGKELAAAAVAGGVGAMLATRRRGASSGASSSTLVKPGGATDPVMGKGLLARWEDPPVPNPPRWPSSLITLETGAGNQAEISLTYDTSGKYSNSVYFHRLYYVPGLNGLTGDQFKVQWPEQLERQPLVKAVFRPQSGPAFRPYYVRWVDINGYVVCCGDVPLPGTGIYIDVEVSYPEPPSIIR